MMCAANNRTVPNGKKPRENPGRGMPDFAREDITPVRPGVVLVAVRHPSQMMQARALIEECTLYGKKIADLPMPRAETLCSLYGGGTRDLHFARGLAGRDVRKQLLDKRMLFKELMNCRRFNAWSNEGIHIVLKHLPESGGCVSAEASIGETREQIIAALQRIEAGAREKNAQILLFVQTGKGDVAWLSEHCGELIVIDKCEPGPGASHAFSLTALSLESQYDEGIGRTMCEAVWQRDHFVRSQTTFIAAAASDRCIWYLAREGVSAEDIAGLFDIYRTTVWRRLTSIRLSVHSDIETGLGDEWRDEWLPFLGIEFDNEVDNDDDVDLGPEQRTGMRF